MGSKQCLEMSAKEAVGHRRGELTASLVRCRRFRRLASGEGAGDEVTSVLSIASRRRVSVAKASQMRHVLSAFVVYYILSCNTSRVQLTGVCRQSSMGAAASAGIHNLSYHIVDAPQSLADVLD